MDWGQRQGHDYCVAWWVRWDDKEGEAMSLWLTVKRWSSQWVPGPLTSKCWSWGIRGNELEMHWNKKLAAFLKLNLQKKAFKKLLTFAAWLGKNVFFKYDFNSFCIRIFTLIFLGKLWKLGNYFCVFTHKRRWVRKQNWILSDCWILLNFTALLQFNWQARIAGMSFQLSHWASNRR